MPQGKDTVTTEQKKPSARSSSVSKAPPGRPALLLVDDDRHVYRTVDRELGRRGWSIHYAPDGLRALQILPEIMPLYGVLADLWMVGLSGCQLLTAVRDAHLRAGHSAPRLVLLTGEATDEQRRCCEEIGALVFIKGESRFSELSRALG
jgi:CheY-like chemotaxis protein